MLDRVRMRALRDAGHTLDEIAVAVGVSRSSVQRVLKEPRITAPESAPTPKGRGIARPSTAEPCCVAFPMSPIRRSRCTFPVTGHDTEEAFWTL